MPAYRKIYKQVGETPLAALERFRAHAGIPPEIPLAYAGRLDPLASGILIILIGEACKQQQKYHALDKAYEFDILTHFSSDTGDPLGIAQYDPTPTTFSDSTVRVAAATFVGTHQFEYPHYSSKTVHGKPLFQWTLEDRLHEIEVPTITSTIHSLTHLHTTHITAKALHARIAAQIESIPPVTETSKQLGNDFRRSEIRAQWRTVFAAIPANALFPILTMRSVVTSGTYIRTLAQKIAESLGTTGLALSIHRTAVGHYHPIKLPYIGTYGWWSKKL